MHYYKRNLGDYAKKAGRLSMLQHGSYTLLIDSCYDREQFPTLEEAIDWTWASSKEEREAVEFVLTKFFELLPDGRYVQSRIQEELDAYHKNAETNKRIAEEREAKRRGEQTKRERSVDEAPPNQEPVTKNHKPLKTKPQAASAKAQEFDFAKSLIELGADENNVASWLKVRKVKKCVNTEEALNGFVREAEKAGLSIADAVLKCAEKSWGGLDADWIKPKAQAVPQRVSAWWASDAMILAKGRELGLSPYAGESMPSFKGRIELKIEGVDKHVDATRGGGFAPVIPPASTDKAEKRDMSPEAVAMRKNALNASKVVRSDDEA